MSVSVNWLQLPADIQQSIRFLQLQERLERCFVKRPLPTFDLERCAVWMEVEVGAEDEDPDDCPTSRYSLEYRWAADEFHWNKDDLLYHSIFRTSDGTVYSRSRFSVFG